MGADAAGVGGTPSLVALSKEGMMAVHASGRAFSVALCNEGMMKVHASGRVGVEGGRRSENGRLNRRIGRLNRRMGQFFPMHVETVLSSHVCALQDSESSDKILVR